MPAFEISGTANFSNITSELQKLNTTLSNIKVPAIKVQEPNFGNFFNAIDKIEAKTIKIKSVIEPPNTVSGGFSSFLNSEKGKFANVGKEMGQSLQMGMQQQFGMMGGMATSVAAALGPIGIAAGVGAVGLGVLAAASTKAAMAWEDMKTSIGRTTGLKGDNLEDLMNQLQDLRQEFGVTAQAASDMVEQAGSIGVGQSKLNAGNLAGYKQEILDFTKATAILQGAWGMSAEATAQGIGKMGSVTLGQWNMQRKARGEEELSWADYAYRVGGQVDNLANAMGSSEEEIVTAMRNSSGAIAKYAPSEETYGKWQAMASFLIDTGASAGEAGTQIERVAQKMDQNGADVANILGIDQASLSANLKTDFMGTVQSLGEAIAAMPESERPDTAKMFGLEGKSLIDKVVADIEQGTGKLQNAIDLAMSPGNVAEGYEDVADNASKAFDRIGQAAQVSLEKIGGLILPIVTDIANGIADAWVAANNAGSEIAGAVGKVANEGLDFSMNRGEDWYTLDWSGIHKKTAEEMDAATKEGAASGTEDGITEGAMAGAEDAGKIIAEEFSKAQDEYIKSHSSGGYSNETMAFLAHNGSVDAGPKYLYGYETSVLEQTKYASLQNYTLQKSARSTDVSGRLQIADSSGNIIKSESYTSDSEFRDLSKRLKDAIKPTILDLPKYMSSVKDDMSGVLSGVVSDFVVELGEKDTLKGLLEQLDALRVEHPLEFDSSGLLKVREEAEKAFLGIPITFDTGEMETNFALWLAENASMYSTTKTQTGITPIESQERILFDALQKTSDRGKELFGYIDKAATSGNYEDIEVLPEVIRELGIVDPNLLSLEGTTNRLKTAQEAYEDQVKQTGNTFVVIDSSGKSVADAHLRTSVASDILTGGLLRAASAAQSAASKFSGISVSVPNAYSGASGLSWAGASSYSRYSGQQIAETVANPYALSAGLWSNLPKLAEGGKVTKGGLAWIGEAGTEYVIPESEIKGLYPESANVDLGNMTYRWFQDYLEPSISTPSAYRWSHFPDAPQVHELNTEGIQTAWLADQQLNSRDIYSGKIRQAQLDAIGQHSITPWFARGMQEQPDWWVDAATQLSPDYADAWGADKGGSVADLAKGSFQATTVAARAKTEALTVKDAWSQLYGESFTEGCIATNAPDASLKFTPSSGLISEIGRTMGADASVAWNQLYGESFTEGCIGTNTPDSLLKFTPSASLLAETARARGGAWGSEIIGGAATDSSNIESSLVAIEKNTSSIETLQKQQINVLEMGIFETGGALSSFPGVAASSGNGALVTGLSKEGYVVTYDPRTDTCEGLAFNPPDPSLKTTDPFYLGITSGNLVSESYDEGYGWGGRTGWTDDPTLQAAQAKALAALEKSSAKTEESSAETAKNTAQIRDDQKAAMVGMAYDASGQLVAGGGYGGGGSSIIGLANRGGGTYWGGTSINGGGAWVGGGASLSGWGAQASSAASSGGSSSWGSVQWAEGGITDHPVYGVFGEAGREAFVPISDRAAGLRILPQVMRELGVRTFAAGGIAGRGGLSSGMPAITIDARLIVSGSSRAEIAPILAAHKRQIMREIPKQIYEALKR